MHTRAIAVTLVLAAVALSACAQRGGSHGGSIGHAGAAMRSTPVSRGSFAPTGRPSFIATPHFSASRYAAFNSNQQFFGRQPSIGYPDRRSGDHRNDREDRFRSPYGSAYGIASPYSSGWFGPDYLGYTDAGYGGDSPSAAPPSPLNPPGTDYDSPPAEQAETAPPTVYRPTYQRPQPPPEPAPEDAVTLIFKDGRPTEQIHNYMLTRTILYVQGQRLREIPVDQLDLAATEKVNQDAGVDFQLPHSSH